MKIYINNEAVIYENNGIFAEHFEGFAKTAQEENAIIIVREVNPITKVLLPQKYPTKSMDIKNKSSDWGIQAGFVISLAELTFLNKNGLEKNETQIEKLNLLCNKFSIKLDKNNQDNNKISPTFLNLKENETILTIDKKHFNYLISDKKYGIIEFEIYSEKIIFVKCSQPKNKQNKIIICLEKEENDSVYKVYYIFALDDKDKVKSLNDKTLKEILETEKNNLIYFPITVFCKVVSQEKKPLIPDYDLFAICWLIDYSIKYHQPCWIPTNSFARMKPSYGLSTSDKQRNFKQDPKLGNASVAIEAFLDKLNINLGYEKGLNDELCPIHHTFELVNPYSKGFIESLYTVFLPNPELLTDFSFPEEIAVKNQKNISYFIIDDPLGDKNYLWKNFLEPLFIHFKAKGYYVPNNCFIEQTDSIGFVNSFNPWFNKIKRERIERQINEADLKSEFDLSIEVELINNNDKKEVQDEKEQFKKLNLI